MRERKLKDKPKEWKEIIIIIKKAKIEKYHCHQAKELRQTLPALFRQPC